ncbi:MAG: peptidase S8, partial [Solirubrobacterales bacterium]|nr:peptidase S8 [Solirubrobacterales bacterium]
MDYIVLRDLRRTRVPDPFGSGGRDFGSSIAAASPPEPQIDVEDLDVKGRNELVRDPAVVAITR